jgi:hypothetical protein
MVQGNNSESRAELTSWVLGYFFGSEIQMWWRLFEGWFVEVLVRQRSRCNDSFVYSRLSCLICRIVQAVPITPKCRLISL